MSPYKSPCKIGFCVYQDAWPWGEVASTRIRVSYVAKYMKNAVVSSKLEELKACDVVIFQTRYTKPDVELAKELKALGKPVIVDLTDPHWSRYYNLGAETDTNLVEMIELADLVTVPTDVLRREFEQDFPRKVVASIPDRMDLATHNRLKSHTGKKELRILWHGSYGNIPSLELAREDLERLGREFHGGPILRLICIYDRTSEYKIEPFSSLALETREWSNQAVIDGILEADVCVNPRYPEGHWKNYKSNNKTIKSWALGVPCVERNFYAELGELLSSASLRHEEGKRLRRIVEEKYDSRQSAEEIENIVDILLRQKRYELEKPKPKPRNDIMVYTAIAGGYDGLKEGQCTTGADFVAFVDEPIESKTWNMVPFRRKFIEPVRDAKIFKVLSHRFTGDYEYSLWMDGNFILKVPVRKLIEKCLKDNDIVVFRHNKRSCIYQEGCYDLLVRKDTREIIEPQLARYRIDGHPPNWGLFACGVILRRNCKAIEEFNNAWWSEISVGSERDQTSFAYLVRKLKVKIGLFNSGEWEYYNSKEFELLPHKKSYDGSFN